MKGIKGLFILAAVVLTSKTSLACGLWIMGNAEDRAEMMNPRAWSYCSERELERELSQLSFQADYERLTKNPFQEMYPLLKVAAVISKVRTMIPTNMVKVSSEYFDIVQNKMVTVEGVGSWVAAGPKGNLPNANFIGFRRGRHFILTAGHVSSGKNLKIQMSNGIFLKIKSHFQDDVNDVAIYEIDVTPEVIAPHPLSVFQRIGEDKLMSYLTAEGKASYDSTTESYYQMGSDLHYFGVRIDLATASAVLIPEWLRDGNYNTKDFKAHELISESPSISSLQVRGSYPQGFSGSPVIVNYQQLIYTLGGILTLADSSSKSSIITGPAPINQLMRSIFSWSPMLAKENRWFLIDRFFAKVENGSLTVYSNHKPIGNGTLIDGDMSPARVDQEKTLIQSLLQKNGLKREDTRQYYESLSRMKPSIEDSIMKPQLDLINQSFQKQMQIQLK